MLLAACSGSAEKASQEGALAQQQLDNGQLKDAQRTIAAAIAERDDILALHLLRGRIEFAAGNVGGAFRAYQDALGLDPTNPEALQGVAQLGLRTGDLKDSEDAADRILTLQPDQLDALLIKGVHHLVHKRTDDALKIADKILAQDPANEGGTILKARALFLDDRAADALALIQRREKSEGRTEATALTELELLREAHDAAGMRQAFDALRGLRPNDRTLRIDEANVRYKTGDGPGGRALLAAVVRDPGASDDELRALLGLWREYDAAPLSPAERAGLARVSPRARLAVARFYLLAGQPAEAAQAIAGMTSLEARGVEARIAAAAGDPPRAAQLASLVLSSDETQCDALIARSVVSPAARAVDWAQRAVAECPRDAGAVLALAAAFDRKGDKNGAWRAYRDGVSRISQDGLLSAAFSRWLAGQGRGREALAEARRLTRKAPASLVAWRAYRALCVAAPAAGCSGEAEDGLREAARAYALNREPGTSEGKGLSGPLERK